MRTRRRLRAIAKWVARAFMVANALLFVAIVTIWIVSEFRPLSLKTTLRRGPQGIFFFAYGGILEAGRIRETVQNDIEQYRDDTIDDWIQPLLDYRHRVHHLSVSYSRRSAFPAIPRRMYAATEYGDCTIESLTCPFWLIAAPPGFLALLPIALSLNAFRRNRRRQTRLRENHCPNCNYNLTANQSGTCPECGTPTPKSEPATQAEEPPRPQQASNSQP